MPPSVSPINWTGNKSCIYETISAFMPPHRVYIEPCMGSAEVFLRKGPAEKEIINDYNGDLVNFFRVLRSKKALPQLLGRLYLSFNSEEDGIRTPLSEQLIIGGTSGGTRKLGIKPYSVVFLVY